MKGLLLMGLALGGLCAVLGAVSATAADTIVGSAPFPVNAHS